MEERASRLQTAYGELLKRKLVSTKKDIAIKMGASAPNVSSAFNGDGRVLTMRFLQRFNAAFDNLFNLDWLINGRGEMLNSSNEDLDQEYIEELTERNGKVNIIPLLPVEAIAGGLQMWSQSVELSDCKKIVSPIPGADFAIHVSGDSMEPEIHNGTYIYIKRINDRAFIPWGNTMVVDTENGVVVKKLFPIEGDDECILAKSVNPAYPPFKIPTESIFGIYRVLGGSFVVSTI